MNKKRYIFNVEVDEKTYQEATKALLSGDNSKKTTPIRLFECAKGNQSHGPHLFDIKVYRAK